MLVLVSELRWVLMLVIMLESSSLRSTTCDLNETKIVREVELCESLLHTVLKYGTLMTSRRVDTVITVNL